MIDSGLGLTRREDALIWNDPESYITEYTLVYQDNFHVQPDEDIRAWAILHGARRFFFFITLEPSVERYTSL
jgi:hypothetical protein